MKTFNCKNTDSQTIKEAKKASKQLRKLRMQHGSLYIEQGVDFETDLKMFQMMYDDKVCLED